MAFFGVSVIRGENVYPSAIEDAVRSVGGLGAEYRVIITRERTMDELMIQTEYNEGISPDTVPYLKTKLESVLRERGLRTLVEILEPNTLERTEFKAKRVIDRRNLRDNITFQE